MTNNAPRSLQAHAQEEGEGRGERTSRGVLVKVYRVTAAAVVLCSVGGLVSIYVSAAYFVQAAGLYDQAAAARDQGGDTNSSSVFYNQGIRSLAEAGSAFSVQAFLEAIALLLISSAYIILVPLSVAMFRRAERVGAHALVAVAARSNAGDQRSDRAAAIVDDTIQAAAQQRRRLVIACVVVLVTFPARAAFDLLRAYSVFNAQPSPSCVGNCEPCQSDRFIINMWIALTPEFQSTVVALSSPLPLFVSLWIITGAHAQAYAISLNILRARLGR